MIAHNDQNRVLQIASFVEPHQGSLQVLVEQLQLVGVVVREIGEKVEREMALVPVSAHHLLGKSNEIFEVRSRAETEAAAVEDGVPAMVQVPRAKEVIGRLRLESWRQPERIVEETSGWMRDIVAEHGSAVSF